MEEYILTKRGEEIERDRECMMIMEVGEVEVFVGRPHTHITSYAPTSSSTFYIYGCMHVLCRGEKRMERNT